MATVDHCLEGDRYQCSATKLVGKSISNSPLRPKPLCNKLDTSCSCPIGGRGPRTTSNSVADSPFPFALHSFLMPTPEQEDVEDVATLPLLLRDQIHMDRHRIDKLEKKSKRFLMDLPESRPRTDRDGMYDSD